MEKQYRKNTDDMVMNNHGHKREITQAMNKDFKIKHQREVTKVIKVNNSSKHTRTSNNVLNIDFNELKDHQRIITVDELNIDSDTILKS